MGRQLKQSVKVFHNLMLYLLLPVSTESIDRHGQRFGAVYSNSHELLYLHFHEFLHVQNEWILTLIIESIDSVYAGALVIAAKKK